MIYFSLPKYEQNNKWKRFDHSRNKNETVGGVGWYISLRLKSVLTTGINDGVGAFYPMKSLRGNIKINE